jgi:hypothetical protein
MKATSTSTTRSSMIEKCQKSGSLSGCARCERQHEIFPRDLSRELDERIPWSVARGSLGSSIATENSVWVALAARRHHRRHQLSRGCCHKNSSTEVLVFVCIRISVLTTMVVRDRVPSKHGSRAWNSNTAGGGVSGVSSIPTTP